MLIWMGIKKAPERAGGAGKGSSMSTAKKLAPESALVIPQLEASHG
jgi:hypothetical protein